MEKRITSTSKSPRVLLEVDGDMNVKGTDDLEIIVNSDSSDDVQLDQDGNDVRIRCFSNCNIKIPRQANVEVQAVHGNSTIKALEGELVINDANGDLVLRSVGKTHIAHLSGNLTAKHIDGDLILDRTEGDVAVKDVNGSFSVGGTISGNLALSEVTDAVTAKAEGDLSVRFDPSTGEKYELTAGGNIACRLPGDASVTLHVLKGANIRIDIGETHLALEDAQMPWETTIGEGDTDLFFSAIGDITIKGGDGFAAGGAFNWDAKGFNFDFDFDFGRDIDEMAEQVSQQMESQMEMIEQQIESQIENITSALGQSGLTPEQSERIAQRAREASVRATAKAQEKMQRAQEKIKHKMEAAQRRAEQQVRAQERRAQRERRSWSFAWPTPPTPPTPPTAPMPPRPPRAGVYEAPGEPVSDEERMMILRMLEQKKIALEEAEQLLSSLEGKAE